MNGVGFRFDAVPLMHVEIIGDLKQSHRICLQFPFESLWGALKFHFRMWCIGNVKFLAFH